MVDSSRAVRELQEIVDALERRAEGALGLWQRASVISQLRAAASVAKRLEDDAKITARIDAVFARLAAADDETFAQRRAAIESGQYVPENLRLDLAQVVAHEWDPWVRRLFDVELPPPRGSACPPEMVDNVPTNFRTILEVADRLIDGDVLYDIGAGSGTVVVLLAFLTGRTIHGVEVDAGYAEFAGARLERFRLKSASIVHADACTYDYADGTAFYLYDPFRGSMLRTFLENLKPIALRKAITVFAFGECHRVIGDADWLTLTETTPTSMRVFRSSGVEHG